MRFLDRNPATPSNQHGMQERRWVEFGWLRVADGDERNFLQTFAQWYERYVIQPARWVASPGAFTWDIGRYYDLGHAEQERVEADMTLKLLRSLREIMLPNQRLIVLDRCHPSYWFTPHSKIDQAVRDQWAVPMLPSDNEYHFLSEDLSFGILGNYDSNTMTVFGEPLLECIQADPPLLFDTPVSIEVDSSIPRETLTQLQRSIGWKEITSEAASIATSLFYDTFDGYPLTTDVGPVKVCKTSSYIDRNSLGHLLRVDIARRFGEIIRAMTADGSCWYVFQDGQPRFTFRPTIEFQPEEISHWAVPLVTQFSRTAFLSSSGMQAIVSDIKMRTITLVGSAFVYAVSCS